MGVRDQDPVAPIALVGVSCRLPGGANSVDELWELLDSGTETWSPVPAERFNENAFYHPSADDPNGTSNHRGGHFIHGDVRDFDHSFFHLSPQQAAAMDPQQRILLEMSYEALESAGWGRETYAGTDTAVYAAMFTTDFDRNLYKDTLDLPTYYITGTEKAILANRISHVLDLHGPSVSLDTGCSGGLVAMHQACQSLRDGESSAAIVAAANLTLNPDHHIGMSNMHLISGSGHSYPFDDRGDGYGRGEGFVVFVLKRLDDAIRDRDPVRAIVRSTAVNQDGYTPASITHPNGRAQAALVRTAYQRACLDPYDVAYVEAHGTGTVAGDQEELGALAEVFTGPNRTLPLYVGSIKGNIGHTENTSGLASVLKAALILERQLIPPVAGFANPKPGLPLDRMSIPTKTIPWPHAEGITPRVSVNSFGFGGANAHAILEPGARALELDTPSATVSPRLFVLSANTQRSLKAMIEAHYYWVEQHPEVPLADLSYTLGHRRSIQPWRFSCVAEDQPALLDGLRQSMATPPTQSSPRHTDVIYVFTGQGAQWAGMGRELLLEETTPSSVFRDSIRASRDILLDLGATWDLEAELLNTDAQTSRLNVAELAQPATTAIQIAVVALLRAQGVRPRAVVGHSSGEIAAAYTAGHLSHRTAIAIAFHRGFMASISKTKGLPAGAMMSVGLGEREVAPYMQGLTRGVATVACINSPASTTISGDSDALDELAERFATQDNTVFRRRLVVDTAYHSHHMQAVAEDYRSRLSGLDFGSPGPDSNEEVAFISSVSGLNKASGFDIEYWTTNLVSPVRFSDAVQALARYRASNATGRYSFFVEVGPHSALAGPVRQCLSDPDGPTLEYGYQSVLQRKVGAVSSALALAGRLFERGVKLDFGAVSDLAAGSRTAAVLHNLPAYTWDHSTKHWHESRLSREYRMRRDPYHDLLGVRITDSTSIEPRWRHMLSLTTLPWLAHHVVDGLPIFPGSGYLCMAVEAMVQLRRDRYPERALETLGLRDVSFLRGLVVPDPPQRTEVQLSFRPLPGADFSFSFSITALSDGEWHEHCKGLVEGILAEEKAEEASVIPDPQLPSDSTALQADEIYRDFAAVGNVYGSTFRGIRSMALAADASQAIARVEIPNIADLMPAQYQSPHLIHPSTLDIVLHTGLPLVGRNLGPGSVMPVHIDELLLSTTATLPRDPGAELTVSTKLTSSHFRTAHADISVTTAGGRPVLSISAIEMRSLGQSPNANAVEGAENAEDICYELDWRPDAEHLRAEDLSSSEPSLADLVRHICFKNAGLSVLELGAGSGSGELALAVHNAIDQYGATFASYDFVDTTSELLDEARKKLGNYAAIRYRTLHSDSDPASQGFEPGSYDVALASAVDSVHHASILLKPNGMLVMVLYGNADLSDASWRSVLQESPTPLDVQLTFHDARRGSLVVVARPKKITQLPESIQILTHSTASSAPSWVTSLEANLRALGCHTSLSTLNKDAIHRKADTGTDGSGCILVVDDQPEAILSDPSCFSAVTALLKQPGQLVWLSPDSPMSMHQITGVARTAHAENDKLRLVTIHASANILEQEAGHGRLLDIVSSSVGRSAAKDSTAPHQEEREYRVRESGTVLVPRLSRSEQLNRAVSTDEPDAPETKLSRFLDDSQPLVLPINSIGGDAVNPRFVFDDDASENPLADDAVEIEAQAIALSELTMAASLGQYAGVVKRVGASVLSIAPNDRVVALGPAACASRPRVSHAHVSLIPSEVPSSAAAAQLLDVMAACHVLHGLFRLAQGEGVLIHGALTPAGRATVATARSIGAHITATAADPSEARVLTELYGIPADDILVARRSFSRRSPQDVFAGGLDAVIQTSEDVVPAEALAYLKPFGSVVAMGQSAPVVAAKLPRNAAMHVCDIVELLQACPELTAGLTAQAAAAFRHLSVAGLNLHTQDVSRVAEALRLIHTGALQQVVLRAESDSIVPVAVPMNRVANNWENENASYVVAGGLGDLGRRLLFLMAHRGAKHLVSLSRRIVDSEDYHQLQAQLQEISPGCRLYCITCDITSETSLRAAANLIQIGIAPVRGVIHSAAILEDRPLDSMTYENYLAASKIKVEGTLALERTFSSPSLDFFVMLSSAVNIVGASGQANYNAGNSVQDAIAQAHRDSSCHFISLSIGWIEDAVHTADNQARLNGLRRAGLRAIRHDELSCILDYALGAAGRHTRPPQAVVGFTASSLSQATAANGNIHSAMFCHVTEMPKDASAETTTASAALTFTQVVATGDSEQVVDFISKAIITQLARLISIDPALISATQGSILALGLDSLVAIELRNWVMREFDAPLQSSEVLTDQTVHVLAEKIASRSRVAALHDKASDDDDGKDSDETRGSDLDSTERLSHSVATPSTPRSTVTKEFPNKLPRVPIPPLEDTLRLFEQSRLAVDSPEDQRAMADAVQEFLEGPGPALQKQLEQTSPDAIAEAYERQIYLQRREPLQDYSEFSVGHPVEAPAHSQAMRAAILTVAVIDFSRRLAAGDIPPDTLHGEVLTGDARDWLFYATRRPAVGLDHMEDYAPNQRVAILRRGHVFHLKLPGPDTPLDLSAVYATYEKILHASEEPRVSICTLTADERDSWAKFRHELELDPTNAASLAAIDSAAFVMCLDDEAPSNAGERHTQFLVNGQDHPFANRWLDKPVQFAVASNGLSAGIYEHAKVDGMDVRGLHRHVTHALFAHPSSAESSLPASATTYPFFEHVWKPTPSVLARIEEVRTRCRQSYGFVDHRYVDIDGLGVDFLRSDKRRLPPKAAVHLTVLLALYLVDTTIRPAWEIVSLATFARGRLDWIQSVTPPVRAFVEAAAAAAAAAAEVGGDDAAVKVQAARSLFGPAVAAHSSAISAAARGRGFVNHMYALLGVAVSSSSSSPFSSDNTNTNNDLPAIFRSHAWNATRRGGPGQDLKIGFMPTDEEEGQGQGVSVRWDEGGFLMEGDRGVYVHCDVREHHASFAVSARPEYAAAVCEALQRAATTVSTLLS
ncbi:Type I Iterative PKS [Diatrype stigma]|uniref:Type I Iterative PKS n=1 Tax=Diatrype stigma TaxID=117547 RepID=A0AAN9YSR2_9PEZI